MRFTDHATQYEVEISGRDVGGQYFVEATSLIWSDQIGKVLRSRHRLQVGETIYVRLVATYGQNVLPLPYIVGKTLDHATRAVWSYALVPLADRALIQESQIETSVRS